MLDYIRSVNKTDRLTNRLIQVLNEKISPAPEDSIWLCTTKRRVKEINQHYLSELDSPILSFSAEIDGDIEFDDIPVEKDLHLKVGCRVMIRANENDYVNGEIGIFTGIEPNPFMQNMLCIAVEVEKDTPDGIKKLKKHVSPFTWENIKYVQNNEDFSLQSKRIGSITQYPITPAYALTIHKSQGLTLQKIHVDFESGCFSPGQAYVAISRCKTLEGITIQRSVRHTDFATHEDAAKLTEAKKN
jgi:ATP-dependent exoDNAse (exonuclease V) alpha subunit